MAGDRARRRKLGERCCVVIKRAAPFGGFAERAQAESCEESEVTQRLRPGHSSAFQPALRHSTEARAPVCRPGGASKCVCAPLYYSRRIRYPARGCNPVPPFGAGGALVWPPVPHRSRPRHGPRLRRGVFSGRGRMMNRRHGGHVKVKNRSAVLPQHFRHDSTAQYKSQTSSSTRVFEAGHSRPCPTTAG